MASGSFWAFSGPWAAVLLPISQLTIEHLDAEGPDSVVRAQLVSQLRTLAPLRWQPQAPDGWVLRIALEQPSGEHSAHAPSFLTLALHRAGGAKQPYYEAREPLFERHPTRRQLWPLIVRGLAVMRVQRQLGAVSVAALTPWLSQAELPKLLRRHNLVGSGHGMQLFVLDELSRRGAREAIPALRGVLQQARAPEALDRQRALAMRAVGTLVHLGAQGAVPDLIDLAQRQGAETVAQLAHAVSQLGGRMAEAYLLTLASGHEHEGVRLEAASALEALLERQ